MNKKQTKKPQIKPIPRNPHEIVILHTAFEWLKIFHYSNLKCHHLFTKVLQTFSF